MTNPVKTVASRQLLKPVAALALCALALLTGLLHAPAHAANPVAALDSKANAQQQKRLHHLFNDYYVANARFNPIDATFSGDNRFDDQLGMSISPKERAEQFARYRSFAKRLHTINPTLLSRADSTSYEILDN